MEEEEFNINNVTEGLNKVLEKTKLSKYEFIGLLMIISLVILLIGVSLHYNRLVADYNSLVREVNECKETQPLGTGRPTGLNYNFSGEGWNTYTEETLVTTAVDMA